MLFYLYILLYMEYLFILSKLENTLGQHLLFLNVTYK